MKKLTAFALAAIATSVFADKATFPYDVDMTPRIATNDTVEVTDETVTLPGTATAANDTVAELNMSAVTFTAIDSTEWDAFVDGLDNAAAMLAVKQTEGVCAWYGYSGSGWVALTGTVDLETTYDVQISFDRTVGSKKIRYAVKAVGDEDYTVLKSETDEWIAQGGSQTVLSTVALKGTGSIGSGVLASGERGAYAQITGVEETFSFDYSNVVFTVKVGDVAYADTLKITLTDGVESDEITQTIIANADNVIDFSDAGLVPGKTYDCTIEVVKEGAPSMTDEHSEPVTLAATADWFGFDNGAFVKANTNNVTVVEGKFGPTDEELPAVVTPTSESAANAKSTVEISVDYTEAFAETAQYDDAQSALALTSDGWKCLAGGSWTAITNDNVSTAAGEYATRAEFDYTANPGKVRFSVKQGSGEWYVMSAVDGGATWFTLAGSATKLAGTSFVGSGKISAIAATYSSTDPIPPAIGEGVITLAGSTDVKLADVAAGEYTISSTAGKKFSMKWTDSTDKYATINGTTLTVKEGPAPNGMDSYNSYALGLDPDSAASKPVLDAAQNASAENVSFKVANVVPNTEVADVTMKLVETETPSADTGTEHEFTNGEATFNLPSGVRYYKVKISIKTK